MKIKEIECHNFSSSFASKKSFGTAHGLKNISLIIVKTECGLKGIGEAYAGIYVPELISPIINEIKQLLIGKNPEEIIKKKIHIPFVSRHGIFKSIYSGVDIALWDLIGRKYKKPIHELLSVKKNNYKIYSSGGLVNSSIKELSNEIFLAKKMGHNGFKMRIGKKKWSIDVQRINFATKLAKKFNIKLMADSIMGTIHPSWSIKKDFFKIKKIAKKIFWLEEPFHPDSYEDYKILVKKKIVKVATGEALVGELEYKSYLYNGLCNIIQIDVTSCGGISEAIRILNIAKKNNIKIAMHVWGSKIASAANAHFAYAFPEVEWLEYPMHQPGINKFISGSFENHLYFKHQKNVRSPGLGVNFNISKLSSLFKYVHGSSYKI